MSSLTPETRTDTRSAQTARTDDAASRTRSPLAGKSYAEGAAALSPRGKDDAAAAAQKEKERQAAAKKSYEDLLGSFLGGKLYDLVKENLSPDKMLGYGKQGLDSGVSALAGLIKPIEGSQIMDSAAEADAVKQFATALGGWASGRAEEWLKSAEGEALRTKIGQWFEGHPGVVVAAALLAAAGAVAANMDVPEIKQKFGLGKDLKLNASIDPGKIRDLVVKGASIGLEYKKKDFEASLTYKYSNGQDGKPDSHAVSARVANGTAFVEGQATVTSDGGMVVKAGAGAEGKKGKVSAGVEHRATGNEKTDGTSANVDLRIGDKTANVSGSAKYDTATGNLVLGSEAFKQFGNLGVTGTGGYNTQGGASAGLKLGYENKLSSGATLKLNGSGSYSEKDGVAAGASATYAGPEKDKEGKPLKDQFKASLDVAFSEAQGNAVSGSFSAEKGKLSASGSVKYSFDEGQIQSLALKLGYRDPKEFEAVILEYKRSYSGKIPEDKLDLLIETTIKGWMLRVQNGTTVRDGSLAGNVTTGMVGKQVSKDLILFGGVKYGYQAGGMDYAGRSDMDRGLWLQAGVQIDKVPLTISFRPEDKAVTVGITIPFGR